MARAAPVLLLVLLLNGCGLTRPTPSSPAPPAPWRRVLANGARVIVQEYPPSGVVAVQLWVRAGARDESATELGLAHYLEHMLFKGTTTRSRGVVEREIESTGGRINAGTSLDFTYYHVLVPRGGTGAAIEMLTDLSVNSVLDLHELELEKKVVLEEIRLAEDSPRRHLARRLFEQVFDGHPYGRPVLGTPEIIRGLTRETLMSFYRRHYVPESFVLVVVGPVSPADVLAAAERTIGRLPRSGISRLPAASPPTVVPSRIEVTRPESHAYLSLGWSAPRVDQAESAVVDLLAAILGQLRTARLVQALREREPIVSSVTAGYAAFETSGVFSVTAQLEVANLRYAEQSIVAEIRRVRSAGVTPDELRRAVVAAEARRSFSHETAEGRAFAYGRAESVWRLEEELAYLDRVRSVTAEQVRQAARRYLDPERYVRVAFVPRAR